MSPWAPTWASPARPPMTSTPRWTGWQHRQDAIEAGAGPPPPGPGGQPGADGAVRPVQSRGWKARSCPLAARGYSRDGKKGKLQIEYGLLTDPAGRPVAVRVFPGNTGDPAAFTAIADVVRDKFGLAKMVMVGDRGMITSARIAALNQAEDGTAAAGPLRVDHRAARPGHPQADGRRRPAAAVPVRSAGPGRDHLPGLPRRAADRLPQPGAGRRPRPQARRPAGRDREAAGPHHRPRPGRTAGRRRADRGRGRQSDQHVQDRQAFRPWPSPIPAWP